MAKNDNIYTVLKQKKEGIRMKKMDKYVCMSVKTTRASKNQFSKMIITQQLKQQHFLANLIVWASLNDRYVKLAYRWFKRVQSQGQLFDTCISTPRIRRFEREAFKSKIESLGLGYTQREILIGLIQMVVKKPKLVNEIAISRADEFNKKD